MLHRIALALAIVFSTDGHAFGESLHISRHVLTSSDPNFGGLSGLLLGPDGRTAQVLTDRGHMFDIYIIRSAALKIDDVRVLVGRPLKILVGAGESMDSEALAQLRNGEIAIGFEQPSRVEHVDVATLSTQKRVPLPEFSVPKPNKGLEAIAHHPHLDDIIALQEAPLRGERFIPIYAISGDNTSVIGHLPMDHDFKVTGADFHPDGRLYVLERAFSLLGFRTRIRSVDLSDTSLEPEIVFESALGQFDNLEGIVVWQDWAGRTRITLVSDDNFLSILRNELVEIVLP